MSTQLEIIAEARLMQRQSAVENGYTVEDLAGPNRSEPLASVRNRAILEIWNRFNGRLPNRVIGGLFNRTGWMVTYVSTGRAKSKFITKPTGFMCNCGRLATKQLPCGHWACVTCETNPSRLHPKHNDP